MSFFLIYKEVSLCLLIFCSLVVFFSLSPPLPVSLSVSLHLSLGDIDIDEYGEHGALTGNIVGQSKECFWKNPGLTDRTIGALSCNHPS